MGLKKAHEGWETLFQGIFSEYEIDPLNLKVEAFIETVGYEFTVPKK